MNNERDANYLMECTADACRQGRQGCPTPQACERTDDLPMNEWDFVLAGFICFLFGGFIAVGPMVIDFLKAHLS